MPSRKRSTSIKKRLSMLKFSVDDIVFTKHRNLVDWPGKILALPEEEDGKRYKVHLFGAQKEIFAPEKNLANFEDSYTSCGCPTENQERNSALWEALFDPSLLGLQRPQDVAGVLKEAYESKENNFTKLSQKQSGNPNSREASDSALHEPVGKCKGTAKSKRTTPSSENKDVADSKNRKKPLATTLPADESEVVDSSASSNASQTPKRPSKPVLTPLIPQEVTSSSSRRLNASTTLVTPVAALVTSPITTPITPAGRRTTCLALKVPNNTPLSPPKNKRTTRGLKRCSQEPQDALSDASLFMEKIQALDQKQKAKRKSK